MLFEGTSVTVGSTREQIERLLRRPQATRITFGSDGDIEVVGFVYQQMRIQITMPIRMKGGSRSRKSPEDRREQARRETWRMIHWTLKATLDLIAAEALSPAEAFLPWIVNPASGQTVWRDVEPYFLDGAMYLDGAGITSLAGHPGRLLESGVR